MHHSGEKEAIALGRSYTHLNGNLVCTGSSYSKLHSPMKAQSLRFSTQPQRIFKVNLLYSKVSQLNTAELLGVLPRAVTLA